MENILPIKSNSWYAISLDLAEKRTTAFNLIWWNTYPFSPMWILIFKKYTIQFDSLVFSVSVKTGEHNRRRNMKRIVLSKHGYQNKKPTTNTPSKQKKNFFCYILSLLAKWNMIFCLYGAFLENSLSKQNFPSPHMLAVCMQGEGESLSFFSKASCTVHGFA